MKYYFYIILIFNSKGKVSKKYPLKNLLMEAQFLGRGVCVCVCMYVVGVRGLGGERDSKVMSLKYGPRDLVQHFLGR